jgi:hypothetical protein
VTYFLVDLDEVYAYVNQSIEIFTVGSGYSRLTAPRDDMYACIASYQGVSTQSRPAETRDSF